MIDQMTATIGELVRERPDRARVFERLGIDYCCGGKKPLATACEEKGLDAENVRQQLEAVDDTAADRPTVNWSERSLTELADHIEATHHAYLRSELPRLDQMAAKVEAVHGERHAELRECRAVFAGLRAELEAHMMKEEQILFPIIRGIETGQVDASAHCGGVRFPITVMEHEHDQAGQALEQLRALTADYTPPDDACDTYRALLDELKTLERDLHQHIHKENNILFPRAIRAEQAGGGVSRPM